jgi:hypothetical protein
MPSRTLHPLQTILYQGLVRLTESHFENNGGKHSLPYGQGPIWLLYNAGLFVDRKPGPVRREILVRSRSHAQPITLGLRQEARHYQLLVYIVGKRFLSCTRAASDRA